MIVEQQKALNESLREDKEFWRDIYSVLVECKKKNSLMNYLTPLM